MLVTTELRYHAERVLVHHSGGSGGIGVCSNSTTGRFELRQEKFFCLCCVYTCECRDCHFISFLVCVCLYTVPVQPGQFPGKCHGGENE